jgi:hypothetical protein
VTKRYQSDDLDWDAGREGYLDVRPAAKYAPVANPSSKPARKEHFLSIRAEERVASLIAAAGMIWAVYAVTVDYAELWRFQILPPGPIEVCGIGVLAWLHAKWRRSMMAG